MSYFAKIEQGIVTDVIAADQEFVNGLEGQWLQTSYNTHGGVHYGQDGQPDGGVALRGNYAGIGFIYDSDNDVFYSPQPYPSWTISAPNWTWESPVPKPTTTITPPQSCVWDEATQSWVILND